MCVSHCRRERARGRGFRESQDLSATVNLKKKKTVKNTRSRKKNVRIVFFTSRRNKLNNPKMFQNAAVERFLKVTRFSLRSLQLFLSRVTRQSFFGSRQMIGIPATRRGGDQNNKCRMPQEDPAQQQQWRRWRRWRCTGKSVRHAISPRCARSPPSFNRRSSRQAY